MVEFEYKPWKKIIVHEIFKYPLEFFLSTHTLGVPEGGVGRPLNWADGLVFEHQSMPPTEDVIKEQLEGRIHWSSLGYAPLDNYQQTFQRPGGIRIPLIDLSNNTVFKEMARWIKESFEK